MKIMVSSTVKDLTDLRDRLYDYLKEKGHEPWISGKPGFPKHLDENSMTACVKAVENCDYFILILDRRAGLTYKKTGTSITEAEYEAASNKPMSIFVRVFVDSQCKIYRQLPKEQRKEVKWDCDPGVYDFYNRLQHLDNVPWRHLFSDFSDIESHLVADIKNSERRSGLLAKSFIPHPYPEAPNFTGRKNERKMLDDWFSKDAGHPVLSIVAFGGMGKSALTWRWMQEEILDKGIQLDGVVWWSFYEKGMTFDTFIRDFAAHKWGEDSPIFRKTIYDLYNAVYNEFQKNNYLIVFDGLERILRAYTGLGSPYQGDKVIEDPRQDYLACIDPNAGSFLQHLANPINKSKTLITTRLHPKELDIIVGCKKEELRRMHQDDAVEFYRREGISGTRAEIQNACGKYGYHPLTMRLLAGMIKEHETDPGNVAVCEGLEKIEDTAPKEHLILQCAYEALDDGKKKFVSSLAAFRAPMDFKAIEAISEFGSKAELTKALKEVVNRGLLFRREEKNEAGKTTVIYDMHPIVRSYCYDRLKDKEGVHTQLIDYFASVPEPENIESIDDLEPVIELYWHTVGAGKYDEACDLLFERLIPNPLYYQFGAYNLCTELLSALFPDGLDKPPRLKNEGAQAWTLNELANSFSLSGQPGKAVPLSERQIEIREKQGVKKSVAIGLGNLADDQLKIADLAAAEENLRRSIALCQEIEDEFSEAIGHRELSRVLAYLGRFEEAKKELYISTEYWKSTDDYQGLSVVWAYRAISALLQDEPEEALEAARQALEMAEETAITRYPHERDFIRAHWLLGAARLALKDYDGAEKHLSEALARCRRINNVEHEAPILLERAKLHLAKDRLDEAESTASEALEIANRCGYVLQQTEVHYFLAQLYKEKDEIEKARQHAETARDRALQRWDIKTETLVEKPPEHAYAPLLEKAEALLNELASSILR